MSTQKEPSKPRKPKIRKDDDGNVIVTQADGSEKTIKPGEIGIVEVALPEVEDPRPDQPDIPEEGLDYATVAEDLLKREAPANGVQVFDGNPDKAKLEDFGYQTAAELRALIHFIEANDLTGVPPWAAVYTLYRALGAYAEAHP